MSAESRARDRQSMANVLQTFEFRALLLPDGSRQTLSIIWIRQVALRCIVPSTVALVC